MRTTRFFAALIASTALAACGDSSQQPASGAQPDQPESAGAQLAAAGPDETPAAEEPAAGSGRAGDGEYLIAGLTGNAATGRRVFVRCQACHVMDEGVNRSGPSLHGIFGRTAGTVEGFRYSNANANSGVVWDAETMFEYLQNPRAFMPGTTMAFAGIRSAQERADVIAYMKDNGGVAQ